MRILGIADGQTSGAAIVEDGRILAALNEERIVRIKLARGFPWESIHEVLRLTSTDPADIGGIAIGTANMELREKVMGWPGWFEARAEDGSTVRDTLLVFGGSAGAEGRACRQYG